MTIDAGCFLQLSSANAERKSLRKKLISKYLQFLQFDEKESPCLSLTGETGGGFFK